MSLEPLYLLHTQPDPKRLATWAARKRLLSPQGDLGYVLHALLKAAFGKHAPQPFRYLDADKGLLAYTHLSTAKLSQCVALADPDVVAALGLGQTLQHNGMNARPFPTQWAPGHVLGFEVRSRPTIREGKTGRERDAFLSATERAGSADLDRSEVYVEWLRELLVRQGGAEVIDAIVTSYQLLGVTRKTQKNGSDETRHNCVVSGPEVVFTGQLRVTDSQSFAQILSRGVGRHRAFGFGLLLLRSVRS